MVLVMDIGNTNIVFGVYRQEKLIANWRASTHRQTADEFGMLLKDLFQYEKLQLEQIKGVIISSVVPPLTPILEKVSRKYCGVEPLVVGPGVKTGMNILYDNPREVGADRIVNAVAAYHLYGGPVIIVDFGTATTFCAVSKNGCYLGGAIAPGIGISTEALFNRAAKLPRIELVKPEKIIGTNTVSSMQSGVVYGYIGLVNYLVKKMKEELGDENTFVVATGGFAKLIAKDSPLIDEVNPLLTLEGLRLIYEKNKQKSM